MFVRKDGEQLGGRKDNDAIAWFKANDIEAEGVPHLHAKFYMNEREAVVTSMNLIKSSWSRSLELGFVVEGDAHQQLVSYLRETLRVVIAAKEMEAKKKPDAKTKKSTTKPTRKHQPAKANKRAPASKQPEPKKGFFGTVFDVVRDILVEDEGHCIRCGELLTDAEFKDGKPCAAKITYPGQSSRTNLFQKSSVRHAEILMRRHSQSHNANTVTPMKMASPITT